MQRKTRRLDCSCFDFFLIGYTAFATGFGQTKVWQWFGDNSSNIASWVQAFGSIAAIAMGVWAVRHQLAQQQKNAEARRLEDNREKTLRAAQLYAGHINTAHALAKSIERVLNKDNVPMPHILRSQREIMRCLNNIGLE